MEDALVICPINKNHIVCKGRMQYHLIRCKQIDFQRTRRTCPFNPIHVIHKNNFEAHIFTCPDGIAVQEARSVHINEQPLVGTISVQEAIQAQTAAQSYRDDWDAESSWDTYDPSEATRDRPVLRPLIRASKREKRLWRQQEYDKMVQLDNSIDARRKQMKSHEFTAFSESSIPELWEENQKSKSLVDISEEKSATLSETDDIVQVLRCLAISDPEPEPLINTDDFNEFPPLNPCQSPPSLKKSKRSSKYEKSKKSVSK